jgi:hypothetical protein
MRSHRWILAAIVALPGLLVSAAAFNPAVDGVSGHARSVQWLYDSPLCVTETITDLGGGSYQYTYSFTNADPGHIWHFGVWSAFGYVYSIASWAGHPEWEYSAGSIDALLPEYDGRNLDPAITWLANTWGPNWPDTYDPINPGEAVTGFSFVADGYDDGPKWYFYETTESGYAGYTGYLAAVGQTGGGPSPTEPDTWTRIKALYR